MPDMLVKLYDLPPIDGLLCRLAQEGVTIKRAMAADLVPICRFVEQTFNSSWMGETQKAICNLPATCFVAVQKGEIVGFACYDTTAKDFFGPTGVLEAMRGKGVGKALYLKCLHTMYEAGYAYAIIGDAGPVDFYAKVSGAAVIPDCWPGEFQNLVRVED